MTEPRRARCRVCGTTRRIWRTATVNGVTLFPVHDVPRTEAAQTCRGSRVKIGPADFEHDQPEGVPTLVSGTCEADTLPNGDCIVHGVTHPATS